MFKTSPEATLQWVRLTNYRSFARCAVELRPLTFVVGRNGAGKSNFLDALQFVKDALENSLGWALGSRGGLGNVRNLNAADDAGVTIELRLGLGERGSASYGFKIRETAERKLRIEWEKLEVRAVDGSTTTESFVRDWSASGEPRVAVRIDSDIVEYPPPLLNDRLYLVNASNWPQFRKVYDELLSMGFYNLEPRAMRELRNVSAPEPLHEGGENIASVLGRLEEEDPDRVARLTEYLQLIQPDLEMIQRRKIGSRETVAFSLAGPGSWLVVEATAISDGTLRALGALLAAHQRLEGRGMSVVGIEEPESALHPAAVGVLIDGLREASRETQVLVTSHSPELLDELGEDDGLLVVVSDRTQSRIGPVDAVSRSVIADHLYTAGELLRMDQLQPAEETPADADFFDERLSAAS